MAVYKVLQDIEAEDKFVGPLTLKQFIFMAIAFVSAYLTFFFATKHIWFLAIPLLPIIFVGGFLGFPWRRDQPTEIWLLAKLRFLFKPRRRIWDQSGEQDLVTITAPKKIERYLSNNLSQIEVKSRLKALAETIDSRGWAAKDVAVNMFVPTAVTYSTPDSDRLVGASTLPMVRSQVTTDVQAADDMLDEQHNPTAQLLDQKMTAATASHRKETLKNLDAIRAGDEPIIGASGSDAKPDFWFMNQPDASMLRPGYAMFGSQTVQPGTEDKLATKSEPTAQEKELIHKAKASARHPSSAYGNTKIILPLDQQPATPAANTPTASTPIQMPVIPATPPLTPPVNPAILRLASNDDLSVATIAREANKNFKPPSSGQLAKDEVIISLH